ncbi:nitrogenase component 1 [Clostridium thailandense]|uniref:nitrogenase component 1 n=1 Tax=Clostridium thailandense TaxID=2794346 RepID=UPI003989C16A
MKKEAYYITAENLAAAGKDNIPAELVSNTHLIYSSPATLAFNSPGAKGFGVKRAALAIPGSIMLLVAPGCCGRNTAALSVSEYDDRIFYLMMDETDIVTGAHLKNIPQAVEEICQCTQSKPSVVMICLTCVDALLGTDMERVCRKAMEKVDIPVLPCYMYALTREGRKPPMVHVRQSIYSLLEPMEKKQDTVNILGYFAPLIEDSELYDLLHHIGIKKINEISRCRDFDEYMHMAEANFNLVLNPEARFAAEDIMRRLNIPSAELTRLYQIDKIQNQYRIFTSALGASFEDQEYYEEAKKAVDELKAAYPHITFAVGETMNANSFELSLALLRYGFKVAEIYKDPTYEDFVYIRKIAKLSPETKIYSNLEPTMIYYDCSEEKIDITIGKDAEYYHPDGTNVPWNEDIQPFGYAGVKKLFKELKHSLDCSDKEA